MGYLETLEKLNYENEEELENAGFVFVCGDNSYNYEDKRILTQSMLWRLYIRKNPKGRGYNYAVAIRLHNWGDIRGNYTLAWIYKTNWNCFQYLIWICDARHLRAYNRDFYHLQDIDNAKFDLECERVKEKLEQY